MIKQFSSCKNIIYEWMSILELSDKIFIFCDSRIHILRFMFHFCIYTRDKSICTEHQHMQNAKLKKSLFVARRYVNFSRNYRTLKIRCTCISVRAYVYLYGNVFNYNGTTIIWSVSINNRRGHLNAHGKCDVIGHFRSSSGLFGIQSTRISIWRWYLLKSRIKKIAGGEFWKLRLFLTSLESFISGD
jgi:hypothetical protein